MAPELIRGAAAAWAVCGVGRTERRELVDAAADGDDAVSVAEDVGGNAAEPEQLAGAGVLLCSRKRDRLATQGTALEKQLPNVHSGGTAKKPWLPGYLGVKAGRQCRQTGANRE